MTEEPGKYEVTLPTKREPTYSERFAAMVVKEFATEVGAVALNPYQQRLAQHMFVAIDAQLKALDAKREGNKIPIVWANINMTKLAIDAVHRIELGLDALVPNHIHPIPYLNSKTGKYDLDLRIGYAGKDSYRRKVALTRPLDVIYELVYANDNFKPIKKDLTHLQESYEFEITNPFDRGEIIGGFGYIVYEDSWKNQLVIVTKADFDKAKKHAQSKTFWDNHPREMAFKTLVHRVTDKLAVDPERVNASFLRVEVDEAAAAAEQEAGDKGNKGFIDVEGEEVREETLIEKIRKAKPRPGQPSMDAFTVLFADKDALADLTYDEQAEAKEKALRHGLKWPLDPEEPPKQEEAPTPESKTPAPQELFEKTVDGYIDCLGLQECREVIGGAAFSSVRPEDRQKVLDALQAKLEKRQAKGQQPGLQF